MRDPRHPRHFPDDFKRRIVDLYNACKPRREIVNELDLGKSTVERWGKSVNATARRAPRTTAHPSRTGSWSSSARAEGSGWRSTS